MSNFLAADITEELLEELNAKELAELIIEVKAKASELSLVRSEAERRYLLLAEGDIVDYDDLGRIEIRWSRKRTGWQHEDVSKDVARYARTQGLINTETGEVEDPVETVRRWLLKAGRPSSWSVKALDELGLDASEYCKEAPATAAISTPKKGLTR
jgi:hypothetical protein